MLYNIQYLKYIEKSIYLYIYSYIKILGYISFFYYIGIDINDVFLNAIKTCFFSII